jgi:hypothetical protein
MAGGQRLISWLNPCSTSNVTLNTRTCAHGPLMGHSNWVGVTFNPPPPAKNPTSSSVQLTHLLKTHMSCRASHPKPTRACICPHTDPSKCSGMFPLSAGPYDLCRRHMAWRVSYRRTICVMRPMVLTQTLAAPRALRHSRGTLARPLP